jgi:valyl-tRNA synthetase
VLVTGFDIIFFWVARMMMMGLHFMKDVPFPTVYIHALVRDEFGQKMSKSKGNIIDPLELIEKYGADALRFTLAAMAAQGRDVKLSEARVEGYRNFSTKLWNAVRFCQMNGCAPDPAFDPAAAGQIINRWLIGQVVALADAITQAIESFRFNEAAGILHQFVWHEFCDWYLEFSKPVLGGDDEAAKRETRAAAAWALGHVLHLLHPFMPFITEELWEQVGGSDAGLLITARWPRLSGLAVDERAIEDVEWAIRLIGAIRAVRAELNVPPAAQLDIVVEHAADRTRGRVAAFEALLAPGARLRSIEVAADRLPTMPKGSVQVVVDEATVIIPLAGVIDLDAERRRLAREIEKVAGEIAKIDRKLANEEFLAKAPPEVVEDQRDRRAESEQVRVRLAAARDRLGG